MVTRNAFPGRVVFDHLPKTAGQAINAWLSESLGSGCITTNLIGNHQDLIRQYGGLYSVISAHTHFQNAEGLDPRYQYMTIFRDPVDRVVSWLYFVINNHDETQIPELRAATKIFLESDGQFASKSSFDSEQNPYFKSFIDSISNAYVEHFCRIYGHGNESDDEKIANAFAAIQQYDVVGIYTEMQLFLADVANLIGLTTPQKIARVNTTVRRPNVDKISPALRERIIELNQLDLQLFAKIAAWKACTAQIDQSKNLLVVPSIWEKYEPVRERVVSTSDIAILSATLREGHEIRHGELMTFDLNFFLTREISWMEMGIHIFDVNRQWAFGINSTLLGQSHQLLPSGSYRATYHLIADLPAGKYTVGFAFAEKLPEGGQKELAWHDVLCEFQVFHQVDKSFAGYAYLPTQIVLNHTIDITRHHFSGGDPRLNTSVGSRLNDCMLSSDQEGYLIYGPYIPLIAGNYQVDIYYDAAENGLTGVTIDVVSNKGICVHAKIAFIKSDEGRNVLNLSVFLATACNDLEVRVWCTKDSNLKILAIEINQADYPIA